MLKCFLRPLWSYMKILLTNHNKRIFRTFWIIRNGRKRQQVLSETQDEENPSTDHRWMGGHQPGLAPIKTGKKKRVKGS